MAAKSYEIRATPKLIERIYYALKRCKERSDLTSTAINVEIAAMFGKPLTGTTWAILNAARRDEALDRVTVKLFDVSAHGRKARLGKTKVNAAKPKSRTRVARSKTATRLKPDPKKLPGHIVAVWRNGVTDQTFVASKLAARRRVAELLGSGVALSDIGVYSLAPMEVRLSIRN